MDVQARAVLLDMDGTLVRSIGDVEAVWGRWCESAGVPLAEVLKICHGVRSHEVVRCVAPHLEVEVQVQVLEEMEIRYATNADALCGASDFLKSIRSRPWAVVTSASRKVAKNRLTQCKLPFPDILISSDDVVHGKPNPEPYLTAASRLNLDTRECLVFEDAKAGIQSALDAGCKVIQVGGVNALHQDVLAVIHDWQEIEVSNATDGFVIHVGASAAKVRV